MKVWIEIIGNESKRFLPLGKSPDTFLKQKSLHERFRNYLRRTNLLEVEQSYVIKQNNHGKKKEFAVNRYKNHFHCFRHTMASIIYNKTSDIYAVNQFLGHKQLDTTTVYAKITCKKMRKAVNSVFNRSSGSYTQPRPQTIVTPQPQIIASNPMQLLETQFISGEISEEEFLRKKQVLNVTGLKKAIELK